MVDARIAFEHLNSAAPEHCVVTWLAAIETAEQDRVNDVAAMDIMHSEIKKGQTLKEIMAEIMTEDVQDASKVADKGDHTEWLLEGLYIEDEQLVSCLVGVGYRGR